MVAPLTKNERTAANQVLALLHHLPPESVARVLTHVEHVLDPEEGDGPRFSRGIAGPLGKLEHALKTKVDEHTHTLFLQQCSMQSTDASNQLRNCVYALVHGRSYDQMVVEKLSHEAQRTQALAKLIGPFGGPEFDGANGGGARTE
ncbi:hypothetical protein [Acidovorax sp. Leaf84]|uniref:hypothetical protein n=1 Tax=Acidovorax sp. Leaf84 TaxID=1736240 RepID=UPI000A738223|nr:hypothetical protein [Acidovorax sp. Leaf84]